MKALHRRWKLALVVVVPVCGGASMLLPLPLALACGIILGSGLVVLIETLDRTVKTGVDVNRRLGLDVYATLPRLAPADGLADARERQLVTGFPAEHPAVQAFQSLCRRLERKPAGSFGQVIMVTSCIPGEGKSTVSGNLAASLAQSGGMVLLVGCDLRRPTLGEMFGQTEQPGLTELLVTGGAPAFRKLSVPPLDLLPGGSVPDNPAELLDSERMRNFLQVAQTRYDYIVLDAPPILPVTDGQLLAPLADVLLAVMEPCRTQLEMARQLVESLQAVGGKIDGVILNDKSGLAGRYYGGRQAAAAGGIGGLLSAAPPARWPAAVIAVALAGIGVAWWLLPGSFPEVAPLRTEPLKAGSAAKVGAPLPAPDDATARSGRQAPLFSASQPASPALVTGSDSMPHGSNRASLGSDEITHKQLPVAAEKAVPPAGSRPAPTSSGMLSRELRVIRADVAREKVAAPALPLPAVPPEGVQPALDALARAWQKPGAGTAGSAPHQWFAAMGMQVSATVDDLDVLLQLNTPLLLESRQDRAGTAWVAVIGRKGFKWQVSPPTTQGEWLSETELKRLWAGRGYLPLQDPLQLATTNESAAPEQVTSLQQLLARAGALQQFEPGVFDRETIKAIGHLQASSGLRVNGRITPETLIVLYQADPQFRSPKFSLWP